MSLSLWRKADEESLKHFKEAIEYRDAATALFAIEGLSLEKQRNCHLLLSKWAEEVELLTGYPDPHYQVPALTTVLVEEQGFRGEQNDYYNPRNSYLSQVMKRRRGLPILLSCIWGIVGRRAGIPVEGVGLPYHFITRVGGPEGILVDPFEGGRILTEEDCEQMFLETVQGKAEWTDTFLEPADMTSTMERVLRNLISSFNENRQHSKLYRCIRFAAALRPENPQYVMAQARLAEDLGAKLTAEQLYIQLNDRFPEEKEGEEAITRLHHLTRRERLIN